MTERFVPLSSDGSRDALYERRSALSRDLLEDDMSTPRSRRVLPRRKRPPGTEPKAGHGNRIRTPELVLGIVLVVGGALAASLFAGSRSRTVEIVGSAREITRGEVITAQDLVALKVDAGLAASFVPIDRAKTLLGRVVTADINGGVPIVESLVAELPDLGENESIVSVRVEIGDVPGFIAVGDSVRIALVPDQSLTSEASASEFSSVAKVWHVEQPTETVEDYIISLVVPREFLLAAATSQRMKIALVGIGGPK